MMSSTVDTNKNEIMKSEENDNNDLREMDAADTLVALANTPTNEYKSNWFLNLTLFDEDLLDVVDVTEGVSENIEEAELKWFNDWRKFSLSSRIKSFTGDIFFSIDRSLLEI